MRALNIEPPRISREAPWFESGRHGLYLLAAIVVCLSFGWRDVTERLKQSMIVEPTDPFERGQLHGLHVLPGAAPMNDFSLVQAIDRLGQRIVVAVPRLPTDGSMPASARRSV